MNEKFEKLKTKFGKTEAANKSDTKELEGDIGTGNQGAQAPRITEPKQLTPFVYP